MRGTFASLCFSFALFGCQDPERAHFSPIDSDGADLRDAQGRAVILRGVNLKVQGVFYGLSSGHEPAEVIPSFDASDVAEMRQRGLNLVRLPINWSEIEPERDQLDEAYLDRVAGAVEAFRGSGIYVLLDLHEDGWSKFICEDGAPLWATIPAPTYTDPNLDCHVAADAIAAFHSFFADAEGLKEQYLEMLAHLARRFAGDETVLGYEIMNEPIERDDLIAAFNEKAAAAIRAVDAKHLISFEPSAIRNQTNFSALADRPLSTEGGVYSVHIYTPMTRDGILGSVAAAREEADSWKTPLLLTEVGVPTQDEAGNAWITALLDGLDAARGSVTYWLWKDGLHIQNPDGTWRPNEVILSGLSRPYAEAVGGDPLATTWDGNALTVRFRGKHGVKARHLVYFNQGAPSITCDGEPVPTPPTDPATQLYEVDCGGPGDHTLAFAR